MELIYDIPRLYIDENNTKPFKSKLFIIHLDHGQLFFQQVQFLLQEIF